MSTLTDAANRLRDINLVVMFDETITETQNRILNHNRMQLLSGLGVDGFELGTYATEEYADFKASLASSIGGNFIGTSSPYGVYNFQITGVFQNKMFLKTTLYDIEIDSADDKKKRNILAKLAGGEERVFGLTQESLVQYRDNEFTPIFFKKIRRKILLNK